MYIQVKSNRLGKYISLKQQPLKAGESILISNEIDFKRKKMVTRENQPQYIMRNDLIHQKMCQLYAYVPNNWHPKQIKQKVIK